MSSARTCSFKLRNGTFCGRPITAKQRIFCDFHVRIHPQKVCRKEDQPFLKEYVKTDVQGFVDLSQIEFRNVEFDDLLTDSRPILFDASRFDKCSFYKCTFKDASFASHCRFDSTTFRGCTFKGGKCDFSDAAFLSDDAPFEDCTFLLEGTDQLDLTEVSFRNARAVVETSLFKDCYVRATRFAADGLHLQGRSSPGALDLVVCEAHDRLPCRMICLDTVEQIILTEMVFSGTLTYRQPSRWKDFKPVLHLMNINFDSMVSVRFFAANLQSCHFQGSSISNTEFQNCQWQREGGFRKLGGDRGAVNSNESEVQELVRLYVQLKKNFESKGDHIGAGDWHYREMESRRQLVLARHKGRFGRLRRAFSLIGLYRCVSRYGESYHRPLCWLAAVWFVFSIFYFFTGFSLGGGEIINYDWCPACGLSVSHVAHFFDAMLGSLSVMALQAGKTVEFTGFWSILASVIQLVLTAVLVPLFLLAVRRKFRR